MQTARRLKWSGGQAQKSRRAGLETEQQLGAHRTPSERADRAVAGKADQNLGRVSEADEQNEAVGVTDGQDERLRMKRYLRHARLAHAAFARRLAHRAVLFLE